MIRIPSAAVLGAACQWCFVAAIWLDLDEPATGALNTGLLIKVRPPWRISTGVLPDSCSSVSDTPGSEECRVIRPTSLRAPRIVVFTTDLNAPEANVNIEAFGAAEVSCPPASGAAAL